MSTDTPPAAAHAPAPDPHGARSEEDRVDSRAIVLVGLGSLLVFFLASLAAVSFFHERMAARGPITIPPEVGLSKIGLVEQQQFSLVTRPQRSRAHQLQQLESFGWVDRQAGLAHIPIAEAMRLVAAGARPAPVTGGAPAEKGGQP